MASKGKVADPRAALAGAEAMSVGDMFTKQTKRTSRSTMVAAADAGAKKQKVAAAGATSAGAGTLRLSPPVWMLQR